MIAPHSETDLPGRGPGARAWDLMSEIWKSCKPYIEEIAADCAMTPQQMIALKMLGKNGPMAMSELAVHLGCDASNVTSIVDKLETRRLVERRSSEQDRRVKSLVLTSAGSELFDRAMVRFQQPPPAINNLSEEDQEVLCGIFCRALFSVGAAVPEDLLRS